MKAERVTFESGGEPIVGTLFLPEGGGRRPAIVLDGPLTSVKEQVTGNYARAMAARGHAALAFDTASSARAAGSRVSTSPRPRRSRICGARSRSWARAPRSTPGGSASSACAPVPAMRRGSWRRTPGCAHFGCVAGFFHDAVQQRAWMGDGYDRALREAEEAKRRYEATGQAETIPAVGRDDGPVAMPLAEAYEYYGTPRGGVPSYVNAFAMMSRADTLPYDAQVHAPRITAPTLVIHSEKALAPALARRFFDALGGKKQAHWVASKGQIDFLRRSGAHRSGERSPRVVVRRAPRRRTLSGSSRLCGPRHPAARLPEYFCPPTWLGSAWSAVRGA